MTNSRRVFILAITTALTASILAAPGPLSDADYRKALEDSHVQVARSVDAAMKKHDLKALIAPTNSPTWTTDLVNGDHWGSSTVSSSGPAAISGYPAITLPMGEIHGLPVGVSLVGLPYTEADLIGLADALEQELDAWRPPDFRSTVELGSR